MLRRNILKWQAQNGYRLYDLDGAGKREEGYGIGDLRTGLDCVLVHYTRCACLQALA